MIIYIPRLIESAEQAEALPEGTRILHDKSDGNCTVWWIHHRAGNGAGRAPKTVIQTMSTATSIPAALRRWRRGTLTALVPIEAEEEWTPMVDGHAYVNGKKSEAHVRATVAEWPGAATGHRLVTPWEEQS